MNITLQHYSFIAKRAFSIISLMIMLANTSSYLFGNVNTIQKGSLNIRIAKNSDPSNIIKRIRELQYPGLSESTITPFVSNPLINASNNSKINAKSQESAFDKLLRTYIITVDSTIVIQRLCAVLKKEIQEIEIAEPRYSESPLFKPNDANINLQSFLPIVKAFEAWDNYTGDSSISIGIVDNGFMQNHSDLRNNISINWKELENNGIDDDANGFVDDYRGVNLAWPNDGTPPGSTYLASDNHGTMVAGVAAATWNNDLGIAGAAGKCRFFPIKAGKEGSDRVEYGYEGILYGIMRGFPVINCSWGSANSYSEINQTIIDLAVERNILIVAGAGNDGNKAPFYPASYKGVFSVGETEISDAKTNGSSYGWSTDIMAPGYNVYTTDNSEFAYTTTSGTSFASPIAAALAALVKGKYPTASMQVIAAHIQSTADDISLANTFNAKYLPGRVNFQRALDSSPLDKSFIQMSDWSVKGNSHRKIGDTITLSLTVKNIGNKEASNIAISLKSLDDFFNPYQLLDSVRIIQILPAKSLFEGLTFRIVIKEQTDAEFYLRTDIKEGMISHPFALIPLRPIPSITTFSTDYLSFSLGDYGSLGFVNGRTIGGSTGNESFDGIGFILNQFGSLLYEGGLVIGSSGKIVSGFPSSSGLEPRFRFQSNNQGSSMVLTDSLNPTANRIGLAIQQTVYKLSPHVVTLRYTLYNNWDSPIFSPGLGIYGDWDIGNYGRENRVDRFTEAIPDELYTRCEAEIAWKNGTFNGYPHPFLGMLSYATSDQKEFFPQAAGINSSTFNADDAEFTALLNGGNTIQFGGSSDISMFSGGRFARILAPGDSAVFYILIGADTSRQLLAQHLRNAVLALEHSTGIQESKYGDFLSLSIEKDYVALLVNNIEKMPYTDYSLLTLQGKRVFSGQLMETKTCIPISELANGMYVLMLRGKELHSIPLLILR